MGNIQSPNDVYVDGFNILIVCTLVSADRIACMLMLEQLLFDLSLQMEDFLDIEDEPERRLLLPFLGGYLVPGNHLSSILVMFTIVGTPSTKEKQ